MHMNVWHIVIQCTIVLGLLPKDTRPHPNTLPIRSLPEVNFWVFHLRDLSPFLICRTQAFTFHHYFIFFFISFSVSYTFYNLYSFFTQFMMQTNATRRLHFSLLMLSHPLAYSVIHIPKISYLNKFLSFQSLNSHLQSLKFHLSQLFT